MSWPVTCSNCGAPSSDETSSSPEKREPCPDCGSLVRTAHVSVQGSAAILSAIATLTVGGSVTAEAQTAEVVVTANDAWVDATSAVETLLAPPVDPALAQRTWLIKTEPLTRDHNGACRVSLMNPDGDVIADGIGADLVSGLLNIIGNMLPPDHPEYLPPQS